MNQIIKNFLFFPWANWAVLILCLLEYNLGWWLAERKAKRNFRNGNKFQEATNLLNKWMGDDIIGWDAINKKWYIVVPDKVEALMDTTDDFLEGLK